MSFLAKAIVVWKLEKSNDKGSACQDAKNGKLHNRQRGVLFRMGMAVLVAVSASTAIAQQQVYDDSSMGMLESPSSVGTGLPEWTGIAPADQGLVYRNAGNTVATNADLLIDYQTGIPPDFVIGGYSSDGSRVENNGITLKQGPVNGSVYGGLSHQTIIRNDVDNRPSGGKAESSISLTNLSAQAGNNRVTIAENNSSTGKIYGGNATIWGHSGNAFAGNDSATAAYADSSASSLMSGSVVEVKDNIVNVGNDARAGDHIYGGYAQLNARAADAISGDATGTGINSSAFSTASASADTRNSRIQANDNTVNLGNNAMILGNVYGGYANNTAIAGNASAGNATASTSGGANAYAYAYSYNSILQANNNKVSAGDNATLQGDVYGGYAVLMLRAGNATHGSLITNTVKAPATPGYADVVATNTFVQANNNTVAFNGSSQAGNMYGGYAEFNLAPGTVDSSHPASSNAVKVTGSNVQAINNTILLGETAVINSPSGSLYGGYLVYNSVYAPDNYDVFSGNTLNYSARAQSTLQNMGNFQNYNFTINPAYANTGTALIKAQNITLGTNAENISTGENTSSKVAVVGIHGGNVLKGGDRFVLMEATGSMTGNGTAEQYSTVSQAQQGIALLYDIETLVDINGKQVTATILGCNEDKCARLNPQLKSLSEGYLAGSQLVLRGADMIADDAFMAINSQNKQKGYAPFAILSGQHNRYNSGSHIKSNDYLITGGMSYQKDSLTAGAFLEAGWGDYDTYNSFNNAADVHGDGNDRYYGLGLLGRYEFHTGFYGDASLRFGKNSNKFSTGDFRNISSGENAHYKLRSNYISAHLGGGYILPINERHQLDLSAKYLWTRLGGKKANVAGDEIRFENIQSHRARVFAMLNHQYTGTTTMHAGIGYEHEFDGKAKATFMEDCDIDAPYVRGGTGIFSVGATIRPESSQNLTISLRGNGYVGKREGISGSVKLNYAF